MLLMLSSYVLHMSGWRDHPFCLLVHVTRQYAANIKRPYEVRYDALTQSIQILDNQRIIQDVSRVLKGELNCLHNALSRIQSLQVN